MTNQSDDFFEQLLDRQAMLAILRGFGPERTVALAEQAWSLGITAVEVPVEVPERIDSLRAAVAAGRSRGQRIGAGTICSTEQVDAVLAAGAAFTVAPGYDPEVAAYSWRVGLPHLPGVASPSEIQAAVRAGHTWLKVFPASALGTEYFRALRGPFPKLRMVATGGIDAGNARAFLAAGADIVAVGSALADPAQLPALAALRPGLATRAASHQSNGRRRA